ncbi:MAG: asparagine synthase (glutamine-hydrolyzing) [Chthoniobacterales bacterium]
MCGIAGIFSPSSLSPSQITMAKERLRSRGPDSSGSVFFQFSENNFKASSCEGIAALLQTRLSIRDLSNTAAQPMKNSDGSVWIVYNGEVYGWEKEARALRDAGYHFQSSSDTEFILHAYEEWGDALLERLRGMFAFAIFDLKKNRLFVARDRLGEKPLFYTTVNGTFAFASTARALAAIACPERRPQLNAKAIDAFLTHRYIPAPLSIFENFYKLPAAHSLTVTFDQGKPIIEKLHEYWCPRPDPNKNPTEIFHDAVNLRLVSDRPVGIFLSGGIDSQSIACSLTKEKTGLTIPTFTASFPANDTYDESADAATIARGLGLPQTTLAMTMDATDAPNIISSLDEPFADPSAIPTWYLCKAAAEKITVALTGDGGDELFAGYKRYHVHKRAARLLPRHGIAPERWSGNQLCLKTSRSGRLRRALLGYQLGWEEAYALRFSALDPLSRSFLQPDRQVQSTYWRKPASGLAPLDWMLECDRLNYLPEYILKKSDLCGMAHGLELRSPMLDHFFFEAVRGMSRSERFTAPPKKFLVDTIIGPKALLGRKRGFNPPLHDWLHHPFLAALCEELPRELETLTQGQLVADRLQRLMAAAHNDQRLDELVWLMVVLLFSLKFLLI